MQRPAISDRARSFRSDREGAVAITFAIYMLPLMAFIGVGIDYGRAIAASARLQSAVDSAALAAAGLSGADLQTRATLATNAIRSALSSGDPVTIATPTVSQSGSDLTVSVSGTIATPMAAIIGFSTMTVTRTAIASQTWTTTNPTYGRACVLALEGSTSGVATNTSTISANCGLYINSSSASGLDARGSSAITTTFTCVGNNYNKDSTATINPTPITACPTMSDPFTTLAAPSNAASACAYTKKKATNGETLSPGVYCQGLEIDSGATVTFAAGTYVIRDGQFKIGSNATVTGIGVLFYLTGSNSVFDWGSGATVQLKGLASGSSQGMLLWSATANSSNHKFGCGSTSYLEGAIYSPSTSVEINSNGTANASADWTIWVVKRLLMGSSAGLSLKVGFTSGATPAPTAISDGALLHQLSSGSTAMTGIRLKS